MLGHISPIYLFAFGSSCLALGPSPVDTYYITIIFPYVKGAGVQYVSLSITPFSHRPFYLLEMVVSYTSTLRLPWHFYCAIPT